MLNSVERSQAAVRTCRVALVLALGCSSTGSEPTTPVASVSVEPAADTLAPGTTVQLTADPKTAAGNSAPNRTVTWRSSNAAVATVSNGGLVTGTAAGSATVTATSEAKTGTAAITVTIGDGSTPPPGGGDSSGSGGGGGTPPPPPPPVPVPDGGSCLDQSGPLVTLTGSQGQYDSRSTMSAATKFDARGASWVGAGAFPVEFGNTNAPGMCWSGGLIQGTWPDGTPWVTYHSTAGMFVASPGFVVEDVTIANYGDAIRVENYTDNWTIRRTHIIDAHDDCIENDRLYSGLLDDDFFEGCYVFLSERPGSGVDIPVSGAGKTVTIQNSLVWLKPMPTVYTGPAPGTGPLFKWDNTGTWTGTSVVISNTIFRVDKPPSDGDLKLPVSMGACSGNTIVWLGGGAYPEPLASCFTVTTDKGVWYRAVAHWKAGHPGN